MRPFKVEYRSKQGRKVGRIASCGSPEGVVRSTTVRIFSGEANAAFVFLDGDLFAIIEDVNGAVTLIVQ